MPLTPEQRRADRAIIATLRTHALCCGEATLADAPDRWTAALDALDAAEREKEEARNLWLCGWCAMEFDRREAGTPQRLVDHLDDCAKSPYRGLLTQSEAQAAEVARLRAWLGRWARHGAGLDELRDALDGKEVPR